MHTPSPLLRDGPPDAPLTLLLAHGAGGPMDTPFLTTFAQHLAAAGWQVARLEFPYMHARRTTGRRPGPDRPAVLLDHLRAHVAAWPSPGRLVLGGKSMGGRIASLIADEVGVRGLLCLGYPFHPSGKPDQLRTAHLAGLKTPTLILQGTRDPFGKPEEVAGYALSPQITVSWLEAGDHSLVPTRRSGHTAEEHLATAAVLADHFLTRLAAGEGP